MKSIKSAFLTPAILALLLFCGSCDYPLFVHYTVTNNSTGNIQLNYIYQWKNGSKTLSKDSSLIIPSNQTDTLYIYKSIGPSVYNPEYGNDTMKNVYNFEIIRLPDGSRVDSEIYLMKNWTIKRTKSNMSTLNFKFK